MKLPNKRFKPARKQIILQTIADHNITKEQFFGPSRYRHVVECRIDAMNRLLADGAYKEEIARHMKRNPTFIRYHLDPAYRKERQEYYRNYRKTEKCSEATATTTSESLGQTETYQGTT